MKLFVDCDDTLVRWLGVDGQALEGQNPYGGGAERWEFDRDLMAAVECLYRGGHVDVVVWSGGGLPYARTWMERAGWDWATPMSKDTRIPTSEDICIDDAELRVSGRLVTATEFVTRHGHGASRAKLSLNAYYYSFEPTGVREIDLILSAVARAGKSYHHTEEWSEPTYPEEPFEGESWADRIQNAANAAAAALQGQPTPVTESTQ